MPVPDSHRPSRRLLALQKLMLLAASRSGRAAPDVSKTRKITRSMESLQRRAGGVQETTATVAGVPVRWFRPARANRGLIFHVHGGAFVSGSSLAARAHSALARSNGAELVSVDYRLAPEHPFPAALDDVWAVYSEVARDRPTVIIGESAGGGLALSLVRRALDRDSDTPKGLVTLFPWADLTNSSDSFLRNEHRDLLSRNGLSRTAVAYAGDCDLRMPLVSPLYGSFADFPPTLIVVGTHDCLLDDSLNVSTRMRAAGVDATLVEIAGGFHGFILLPVPESKEARLRISSFVGKAFNNR
ncbi:caprolactone hydrolase [Mycobacteroides abscessus]|uniref:alpha/beta hydrolase n=1 Tax=Mycobacteroides abscessus TaxID=36809 RepID=UPI0005E4B44C|nr:alpha/beta hydrolase [Mycobacteroides abscessus]CPU33562.1 caprolactone hydrolase [Mycobacteroides abscessus]CPX73747.1 caprolactone hydrolase [Mycobacteroides abscessus]CPZ76479.1 caprolactone hydrolase [Mycobacteroides abscessus]